jgi:hypothetical protein
VRMRNGERWECQNRACGCEILVLATSELENGANPRCSCGSLMKKPYVKPEFKAHGACRANGQSGETTARIPVIFTRLFVAMERSRRTIVTFRRPDIG